MKLTFILALLHSLTLIPTISALALAMPPTNHKPPITTTSSTSTSPSPTQTVLLAPSKFAIKIVAKDNSYSGLQTLGSLSLPSSPVEGSLPHISPPSSYSSPSSFTFLDKSSQGHGIVWSNTNFFTPSDFALAWSSNVTSPHSKVYLSNLLSSTDGFVTLVMQATRLFGDQKTLYLQGIGNGLDNGPEFAEVVFSADLEKGELWISTADWDRFPTAYLQIVPIPT